MLNDIIARAAAPSAGQAGRAPSGLDAFLTGPGGLATGAAAGGVAALLLGGAKPKKLAKNAVKLGGAALVGGLAYKAWRGWQAGRQEPAPVSDQAPLPEAFFPQADEQQSTLSRSLMRAMIAAANADGEITADERRRIGERLKEMDIDTSDRAFIAREIENPGGVNEVVRDATSLEIAAELYTASLLAVDPPNKAEYAYLSLLAARLGLDVDLVNHIHAQIAGPIPANAA
jgi:uncharacterized membrane protein YebE (DUF533 family)